MSSSDLREQIEREVRRINGEMHKDALVNLILEQRAQEAEFIAPKLFKASDSAECMIRAREPRGAKTNA